MMEETGRLATGGEVDHWRQEAAIWKDQANEAIELLRRWVDEGAAMGGGPRSALTQDTLDLLRDDTADIPDHFMRGEDGYARQMAWEAGNRG